MRNFISNFMFMINGPGPIEEKSQNLNAAISTIARVTGCGMFAGDCLITWAKSMGFLEDAKFLNAVNAQITPDPYIENAVKGTIWRSHVRCWAAHQCLGIDGDYVEAACHLGISSRMMADYVDFGQVDKTYWLYDLFDNDGTVSEVLPGHGPDLYEQTIAKFRDMSNVRIVKGRIPDSFEQGAPEKIALLHIDMNNAPSERATLEALYDRVQPGGFMIFDDYGWVQYRAQKDSADEFMASRGKKILELPTGQGLAIR
jgi:O-methyltransferase